MILIYSKKSEISDFSVSWKKADFDLTKFFKHSNIDDLIYNNRNCGKIISMLESYGNSKEESVKKIYEYFKEEYPNLPFPTCIPNYYEDRHIHEIFNKECSYRYIREIFEWFGLFEVFHEYDICEFYALWKKLDFNITRFLKEFSIDDSLYNDLFSGMVIKMFEKFGFSKEESTNKLYRFFEELYPDRPLPICIPKYYDDRHFYAIFSKEFPNAKYT